MFLYLAELEVFVIISSSTGLAGDLNLGLAGIRLGLKFNLISWRYELEDWKGMALA